ncbi:MAG: exodeoxyribonuclease VII large subunit [Oscillospiraceae bacterium]|nr:exodeoxyribonuclease VII large subunit [Oscillospiraceae bacterium]
MPDTFETGSFAKGAYGGKVQGQAQGPGQGQGLGQDRVLGASGARQARGYTVSEINRYINNLMKASPELLDVSVSGEVSNFRPHYSGHLYFTLKDSACSLRCVMFRGAASRLRFKLENGQNIVARGSISVFERDGQYQLYCEDIRTDGVGDLYIAYEQLKLKLSEEGLFDQQRKKALPLLPGSVCVITSPTGAVIRDIVNVTSRRFPRAVLKLLPVQVQGALAAPQIARAIGLVNEQGLADVIIVARGGGSIEDLWAFNEEAVARAIAGSAVPVVSAVGHETDFTICDFVSDLRAPTPSAAAELVFPEAAALWGRVDQCGKLLRYALQKKSEQAKRRLLRCMSSRVFARPTFMVDDARMRLNGAEEKLMGAVGAVGARNAAKVALLSARLDALSPLSTLARGYAVATGVPGGETIKSIADVVVGQHIAVRVRDGALECRVVGIDGGDGADKEIDGVDKDINGGGGANKDVDADTDKDIDADTDKDAGII